MVSPRITIIGLTGKAGSGKDYMGGMLWRSGGFFPVAFADPMKEHLHARENIPIRDMMGSTYTVFARTRMQVYGTRENRVRWPQVWLRHMVARLTLINERSGIDRFVITDIRFANEAEFVWENNGCMIWLRGREREGLTEEQRAHISETETSDIQVDYTVLNSTSRSALAAEEVRVIAQSWITPANPLG